MTELLNFSSLGSEGEGIPYSIPVAPAGFRSGFEKIPHSVAVTVNQGEESPTLTGVLATITVERESQKASLIGKKGDMLKTIGHNARLQMQKLVAGKIYLELFVRV